MRRYTIRSGGARVAALCLTATGALAELSRTHNKASVRSASHSALHQRPRAVRRAPVYHGPGYVFVPGKGIIDEACDLPTSACPNDQRDVQ